MLSSSSSVSFPSGSSSAAEESNFRLKYKNMLDRDEINDNLVRIKAYDCGSERFYFTDIVSNILDTKIEIEYISHYKGPINSNFNGYLPNHSLILL